MENKLTKFITDFNKSYRTQHSLVTKLEKWKKALDKKTILLCFINGLVNCL